MTLDHSSSRLVYQSCGWSIVPSLGAHIHLANVVQITLNSFEKTQQLSNNQLVPCGTFYAKRLVQRAQLLGVDREQYTTPAFTSPPRGHCSVSFQILSNRLHSHNLEGVRITSLFN